MLQPSRKEHHREFFEEIKIIDKLLRNRTIRLLFICNREEKARRRCERGIKRYGNSKFGFYESARLKRAVKVRNIEKHQKEINEKLNI